MQAGINLGEARGFQPLPYSGREEVQNLDTQGGSNVTGRYMYRVSGEKPFRGGCTNDTTLSEYTLGMREQKVGKLQWVKRINTTLLSIIGKQV